jgi:hypothetical protein
MRFLGLEAIGATDSYTFEGSANTPVLITLNRTEGDLGYAYELLGPRGDSLLAKGNYQGVVEIAFTPQESGVYTLVMRGMYRYGEYTVYLEWIDEIPPGEPIELSYNTLHTDRLAVGATDMYTFEGSAGTPVNITISRIDGDMRYIYQILDANGNLLQADGTFSGNAEISFTPERDGIYTLLVEGTNEYGTSTLSISN